MRKGLGLFLAGAAALPAFFLGSCAGPSTRILPAAVETEKAAGETEDLSFLEEINLYYMQEVLDTISASDRPAGSADETAAITYLRRLFEDYGYETSRQAFQRDLEAGAVTGTNLIAIKKASVEDADIVILAAHHDTVQDSPGANTGAAGLALLMEVARLAADTESDTEIRFISFSGEENQALGIRKYVETLSRREKERLAGAVVFGQLGAVSAPDFVLATRDGSSTLLGEMLAGEAEEMLGEEWRQVTSRADCLGAFSCGGIPAVLLTQPGTIYEAGTPLDTADTVNVERLGEAAKAVSLVLSEIMSPDTPAMSAKAHFHSHFLDYAFVWDNAAPIPFGEDIDTLRLACGMQGTYVLSNTDDEGRAVEKYQFVMKWFGVDQRIVSNFYFTDGLLTEVDLEADSAGVDLNDMMDRLADACGEPTGAATGPNGTRYDYEDPISRKAYTLDPETDGYSLTIREFEPEKTVLERRLADGTVLEAAENPTGPERITDALYHRWSLFFPEGFRSQVRELLFFTDGLGLETAAVSGAELSSDTDSETAGGLVIELDAADLLTPEGDWRDGTAADLLFAGLYAEYLAADQSDGGIRARFMQQFSAEESDTRAGLAPGEEPAENGEEPDFVFAFQMFVLTGEPKSGPGLLNEQIRFLCGEEELIRYRQLVRGGLGLPGDLP